MDIYDSLQPDAGTLNLKTLRTKAFGRGVSVTLPHRNLISYVAVEYASILLRLST